MAQRTRIGVMLPSSNTTVEWDFQCLLPARTSLHAARMWMTGSDADGLERRPVGGVAQSCRACAVRRMSRPTQFWRNRRSRLSHSERQGTAAVRMKFRAGNFSGADGNSWNSVLYS